MEYKMRRSDRLMDEDKARELLARCEYGVLSMTSEDGSPYAVPLSYIYRDGAVYFHCAMKGRKLDCMSREPRVCFSAVDGVKAVYRDDFTTEYSSVLAFGKAYEVTDEKEKREVLMSLCEKYLPGFMDKAPADISSAIKHTGVYKIVVESISGKANAPK